jgi:hypothetical protein
MARNGKGRTGVQPVAALKESAPEAATTNKPKRSPAQVAVTFFKNFAATSLDTKNLTLPELRDLILETKGKTKKRLPWLKLAQFGDKVDESNCLRTDDNVTGINGIELDYDQEKVTFDEGAETLRAMNVTSLIYTSPRHTPKAPRWRVLLPTSHTLPHTERAKLVGRVNDRFGNIFAPESFTLSQSYYYGMALDNPSPDHRAEIIQGQMIDVLTPDKYNLFKEYVARLGTHDDGPRGFEEHIARLGDGEGLDGFNDPLIRSTAAYAYENGSDFDREELKRVLRERIEAAPKKATRDPADIPRYLGDKYLDETIASAVRKFGDKSPSLPPITATPFVWTDPAKVPPRQWLYRPHYIRKFTSAMLSSGGVGKSIQLIVESLAMVTGRPLLDVKPVKQLRVWYYNGEDPAEELQRRFAAVAMHYKITEDDIGARLYVDSGRIMPIVLVEVGRHGTVVAVPVVDQIIATIQDHGIEVLIIDPFVSTHRVPENDNNAIDLVAKTWSHIADITNCSIMLAHHTRKNQPGSNGNASVDDGRGASAMVDAVRAARTLNTMNAVEAKRAGIHESQRRSYYRSDVGKTNLTPPAERADWFKIVSVDLGNTGPMDEPDTVGVVTAWEYPKFDIPEITPELVKSVMAHVRAGGPWRLDPQSKTNPWIGIPIAEVLKVDPQRAKKWLVFQIDLWLDSGLLRKVTAHDPHTRKDREFIACAT